MSEPPSFDKGPDGGADGSGEPTQPPDPSYGPRGGYPPQPGYGPDPYAQSYPQQSSGYGAYGGYPMGSRPNGLATAALVTGVVSLVLGTCCCGIFGILGGIGAITLGIVARGQIRTSSGGQTGDGLALAGIITGALAVVLAGGLMILVLSLGMWDSTMLDYY